MKYIKTYKLFESKYEDMVMDMDDIFADLEDQGFSMSTSTGYDDTGKGTYTFIMFRPEEDNAAGRPYEITDEVLDILNRINDYILSDDNFTFNNVQWIDTYASSLHGISKKYDSIDKIDKKKAQFLILGYYSKEESPKNLYPGRSQR